MGLPPTTIGSCNVCHRPMRKKGAPADSATVQATNATLCNSCWQRRRRGQDGPVVVAPDALPVGDMPPVDVLEQALCAQTDPEAFFPEKGGSTREAKAVCRACPVMDQCLTWALETNQTIGVWGGMSAKARARLRSNRQAAA